MIKSRVYINNTEIEISDEVSIPLTYSVADIREPEKRSTTFSKTVILPGTQFNNKFFGNLWNVNTVVSSSGTTNFSPHYNPNLKASAIITYKDSVRFTGIVQLLKINVLDDYEIEYEVSFLGELINLYQSLDNKTLDEIDLSAYDHAYTKQNQVNSWSYGIQKNGAFYPFTLGEGYVYPMIDYGYNNGVDWNVKHFFPSVFLKTITDAIFSEAGFEIISSFFESERYKSLVIPYSGSSTLKLTDTQIENRTFRATSSGTTQINITTNGPEQFEIGDESTLPNFDPGGVYNNSTYKHTVQKTGTYTFTLKPTVSVTHFPSANTTINNDAQRLGWFRIVKQGVGVMQSVAVQLNSTVYTQGALTIVNGGPTVTSGATTLEYTGDLSFTVFAYAGDVIYPDFFKSIDQPYNSGPTTASNYSRLNIKPGTLFTVRVSDPSIQEGDTVSINSILPAKFKQSDLLKSIVKKFNLFIKQDPVIPSKLYIEPREDFYDLSDPIDWDDKLDDTKEVSILPMGDLDTKRYIFTYKQDEDYYNKDYQGKYSEVYGQKIFDVENDFLRDEIKNEVIFSPTPLVDTLSTDRIISKIFDVDEQGTIKPKPSNIRLLYYGGIKTTNQPYNYIASTGTTQLTQYGYAGHLNDPISPTFDLSFGVPKEVYYLTDTYTANNLTNIYWKKYLDEVSDKNSKILTGFFHLNELDIKNLDFSRAYYLKGEVWRLNKVYDSDTDTGETTKVEFVKLKEVAPYVQDTGVPIKGGIAVLGVDLAPAATNRTVSTNSYGIKSFGENNTLPTYGKNIFVVGSNNVVGEGSENVTIFGSSGVTVLGGLQNVTLVNSNGVNVTTSNTNYLNGVQVPYDVPIEFLAGLTQVSTGDPDASISVNTLGVTPTYQYLGVGDYQITLPGIVLDPTETKIFIGSGLSNWQPKARVSGIDTISVKTFDNSGAPDDDQLDQTSIHIMIYP